MREALTDKMTQILDSLQYDCSHGCILSLADALEEMIQIAESHQTLVVNTPNTAVVADVQVVPFAMVRQVIHEEVSRLAEELIPLTALLLKPTTGRRH